MTGVRRCTDLKGADDGGPCGGEGTSGDTDRHGQAGKVDIDGGQGRTWCAPVDMLAVALVGICSVWEVQGRHRKRGTTEGQTQLCLWLGNNVALWRT